MSERMTPEQRRAIRDALGDDDRTWPSHTVRTLLNELAAVAAERDEARRWKEAVEDAAVVSWTLSEANENDPRKAINDLLCCVQDMALASVRTIIEELIVYAVHPESCQMGQSMGHPCTCKLDVALAAASKWLAGQKEPTMLSNEQPVRWPNMGGSLAVGTTEPYLTGRWWVQQHDDETGSITIYGATRAEAVGAFNRLGNIIRRHLQAADRPQSPPSRDTSAGRVPTDDRLRREVG